METHFQRVLLKRAARGGEGRAERSGRIFFYLFKEGMHWNRLGTIEKKLGEGGNVCEQGENFRGDVHPRDGMGSSAPRARAQWPWLGTQFLRKRRGQGTVRVQRAFTNGRAVGCRLNHGLALLALVPWTSDSGDLRKVSPVAPPRWIGKRAGEVPPAAGGGTTARVLLCATRGRRETALLLQGRLPSGAELGSEPC